MAKEEKPKDEPTKEEPTGLKAQAKARAKLLKARLAPREKAATPYPPEMIAGMRMELKAIEDGTWRPGWRPPHRRSAYEQFMNS